MKPTCWKTKNRGKVSLRYLGEAGPRRARIALDKDWGLPAEVRYQRWLAAEANLDVALDSRFRRAILVRDDAALPQPQNAQHLETLCFSAELSCDDELDFVQEENQACTQYFQTRTGEKLPVSHPLLKAFLVVLSSEWPKVLNYPSVFTQAKAFAHECGYDGRQDEAFNEALLDFVQLHGVRLQSQPNARYLDLVKLPQATDLARAQSRNAGWPVTNAFHQALDLDVCGRWLLTVMDGSTDLDTLAKQLAQNLAESGIEALSEQTDMALTQYLEFFARQGLLSHRETT